MAPAPLDVSSILAAAWTGSPQGLGSRSCLLPALPGGHRRSAPRLLLRSPLLLSKPDPPHESWGRELVLGETPPPRLEEDFFTHIQSSVGSIAFPSPLQTPFSPWFSTIFYGPLRQAVIAKRHLKSLHKGKVFILARDTKTGLAIFYLMKHNHLLKLSYCFLILLRKASQQLPTFVQIVNLTKVPSPLGAFRYTFSLSDLG